MMCSFPCDDLRDLIWLTERLFFGLFTLAGWIFWRRFLVFRHSREIQENADRSSDVTTKWPPQTDFGFGSRFSALLDLARSPALAATGGTFLVMLGLMLNLSNGHVYPAIGLFLIIVGIQVVTGSMRLVGLSSPRSRPEPD
jgi:hypothetical protein